MVKGAGTGGSVPIPKTPYSRENAADVAATKEGMVPLSEHEQRLLDQIEQALYAEDPKFASAVRSARARSRVRRSLMLCVLGISAGSAWSSSDWSAIHRARPSSASYSSSGPAGWPSRGFAQADRRAHGQPARSRLVARPARAACAPAWKTGCAAVSTRTDPQLAQRTVRPLVRGPSAGATPVRPAAAATVSGSSGCDGPEAGSGCRPVP